MATTISATSIKATYAKLLDGSWGLRLAVADGNLPVGQQITVSKRDGSSKTETLGEIIHRGSDYVLAKIGGGQRTSSYGSRYARGGSAAPVRGYSRYCAGRAGCGCFDCQ
jgi:hypothetical protein